MAKSMGPMKKVKRRSPYSHYNRTVYAGLGTGSFGMGYGNNGGYYNRYVKSPEYRRKYGKSVDRPTGKKSRFFREKGFTNFQDWPNRRSRQSQRNWTDLWTQMKTRGCTT